VSAIDGLTNTVTATIAVGTGPYGVGVDPSTHTVYVPNYGSSSVSVIDEATDTATATIGVGITPPGVGVDPSTHTVYVANSGSSSVSVIDEATNIVTDTITVNGPYAVGIDPSTHTAYVTNTFDNTVLAIDEASNTVTATIGVGRTPLALGVDSSTHAVYVANYQDGTVSVITPVSDDDLAIPQPPNTTDATGPSGATVSYAVPQVSDPDDTSVPVASCTPHAGVSIRDRRHHRELLASDPDDSNSPVTVSFTVTVNGAAAQLADLHRAVQGIGIGNFLAYTVAAAQQQLAVGHPRLACVTLTAFIVEVQVQTPWFIAATTSARLITDAERIQAVLAC
jgi:YVTN family beta-propeller protein